MKKITNILFFIFTISLLLFISCDSDFTKNELSFETVLSEIYSNHNSKMEYIIKDEIKWKEIWNIVYANIEPTPKIIDIDFEKYMLIAVFQGIKNTGGYNIEIEKIIETVDTLEIYIKETKPSAEDMVSEALTQPCHIIKIEKIDKEVKFIDTN